MHIKYVTYTVREPYTKLSCKSCVLLDINHLILDGYSQDMKWDYYLNKTSLTILCSGLGEHVCLKKEIETKFRPQINWEHLNKEPRQLDSLSSSFSNL